MFNMNEYSIAVYGVPLGYHGDPPMGEPTETDDEWCEANGLAPEPEMETV